MDDFDKVSTLIDEKVENAVLASGQKKVHVSYSAYESDENDVPIDNLYEIAAKGRVILISSADSFFGGSKSKDYRSEILENPTWLEVCVCANKMIQKTKDYHHVFLEGLEKISEENNITVYKFQMGS